MTEGLPFGTHAQVRFLASDPVADACLPVFNK